MSDLIEYETPREIRRTREQVKAAIKAVQASRTADLDREILRDEGTGRHILEFWQRTVRARNTNGLRTVCRLPLNVFDYLVRQGVATSPLVHVTPQGDIIEVVRVDDHGNAAFGATLFRGASADGTQVIVITD